MSKEIVYTQFLQSNINRYGWQTYGSKAFAFLTALVFLTIAAVAPETMSFAKGSSLWFGCGVVLAFLLWCGDGYMTDMQERYKKCLSASMDNGESCPIEPDRLSVKAIWRPSILFFHAPIMVMLLLIVMSVK